jgi:hypothetical protein
VGVAASCSTRAMWALFMCEICQAFGLYTRFWQKHVVCQMHYKVLAAVLHLQNFILYCFWLSGHQTLGGGGWGVGEGTRMARVAASSVTFSLEMQPHPHSV